MDDKLCTVGLTCCGDCANCTSCGDADDELSPGTVIVVAEGQKSRVPGGKRVNRPPKRKFRGELKPAVVLLKTSLWGDEVFGCRVFSSVGAAAEFLTTRRGHPVYMPYAGGAPVGIDVVFAALHLSGVVCDELHCRWRRVK